MASAVSSTERGIGRGLVLVAVALLGVLLVLIGGRAAQASREDSFGTALFFCFLAGVGALLLLSALLETWGRARRPQVSLSRTDDGTPSTFVAFRATPLVTAAGVLVLAAVLGLVALVVGVVRPESTYVVVGAVVLLGATVGLLPVLLGGVRPGGVHLTPDQVVHRHLGSEWSVSWEDLRGVVPTEPVALVVAHRDVVRRRQLSRYGWKGEVRTTASDVVGIRCRHLALDAPTIGFLLVNHLDRADLRAQLGTPASLEWQMTAR